MHCVALDIKYESIHSVIRFFHAGKYITPKQLLQAVQVYRKELPGTLLVSFILC